MENQHRELSQAEIDLMNKVKAKAEEVNDLISELEMLRIAQLDSSELTNVQIKQASRALTISEEKLQSGFMWLTRSIPLPETF